MNTYSLSHLSDQDLLRDLAAAVARDRTHTAVLLAHLAEVDERRLYLPAAFPSMFAYCVHKLHLSEDAAFKRIRAARTARQFPAVFHAVAAGRLHLSAVVLLTPYLTQENADELLAAAAHKTRAEIEQLLAERFPQPDAPTRVQAFSGPAPQSELAPGPVEASTGEHASGCVAGQLAPGPVAAHAPRPKVTPLAPERFALQVTIGQSTHDKLRYAQALLGHTIPSGDVAEVLERALDALIVQLEKRKFAATSRPRPQRSSADPRHVPPHVKRTVWERDGGRCSFVGETGNRCPERGRLEFDHVDPVARGGEATVEGIRLRCRAHNQYEAECVFGAGFMSDKRQAAAEARARAAAERVQAAAAEQDPERSVVPWLRQLGVRADDARRAATVCETIPEASLEERMRLALTFLAPPHRRVERSLVTAT